DATAGATSSVSLKGSGVNAGKLNVASWVHYQKVDLSEVKTIDFSGTGGVVNIYSADSVNLGGTITADSVTVKTEYGNVTQTATALITANTVALDSLFGSVGTSAQPIQIKNYTLAADTVTIAANNNAYAN